MRFPGHEAGRDQAVDQPGDVVGAHAQALGKDALGARTSLVQLPEEMGPCDGQAEPLQASGNTE